MAADGRGMVAFSLEVWTVLGLIAAAMLLAMLATASHAIREECRLHDLKVRVHELRAAYQRRLAELRRGLEEPVLEAEVVEEEGPASRAA